MVDTSSRNRGVFSVYMRSLASTHKSCKRQRSLCVIYCGAKTRVSMKPLMLVSSPQSSAFSAPYGPLSSIFRTLVPSHFRSKQWNTTKGVLVEVLWLLSYITASGEPFLRQLIDNHLISELVSASSSPIVTL